MQHQKGGRPRRRGNQRRAPRLRVTRLENRVRRFQERKAMARTLADRIAVAADFLRGAVCSNRVDRLNEMRIERLLDELEQTATHLYTEAARQAAKEGNTPRRKAV